MRDFWGIFVFLATIFIFLPLHAQSVTGDSLLLEVEAAQLFKAGRIDEAIPIARRLVEAIRKRYGSAHPDHARALRKLADIYRAKGDYIEAEKLYKRALAIYEKALGSSHQDLFLSLHGLLQIYEKQGRHKEATPLKKRWLAMAVEIAKRGEGSARRGGVRNIRRPASVPSWPNIGFKEDDDEEEGGFATVPVFYGTDRNRLKDKKRAHYGFQRGRRLEQGVAMVTVPLIHNTGKIERPWKFVLLGFDIFEGKESAEKHFTLYSVDALNKEEFLARVRAQLGLSQNFKDHAFLFVHGYNVSFDAALYRAAQMAYDIGFDGVPFVYSWPSRGSVKNYEEDQNSSEASQPYLKEFINMVINRSKVKNIHIIAHSMGNLPLMRTLKDIKLSAEATRRGVKINQIILAAPDVDRDIFVNLARQIKGISKGITLYASSNDRAMFASRQYSNNPRAGDVPKKGPVIVPGVDTIDVSNISTAILALNHSEYAEKSQLLEDIGKLIRKGLRPPPKRFPALRSIIINGGTYWKYAKQKAP